MSGKSLILVRHGHRDVFDRSLDNGLTEKGREQAAAIRDLFLSRFPGEKPLLLSSPKLRCRETLEPVAEATGLPIEVEPLLLEAGSDEGREEFRRRLGAFLKRAGGARERVVLACSHGDWIPEAVFLWAARRIACKKGSWTEFRWTGTDAIQWVETVEEPTRVKAHLS